MSPGQALLVPLGRLQIIEGGLGDFLYRNDGWDAEDGAIRLHQGVLLTLRISHGHDRRAVLGLLAAWDWGRGSGRQGRCKSARSSLSKALRKALGGYT